VDRAKGARDRGGGGVSVILSFEVFPPARDLDSTFVASVSDLAAVGETVSVTYGASGSGRARGVAAIQALIAAGLGPRITAHLTAAGQPRAEIDRFIDMALAGGVRRFLALRGDSPPAGPDEYGTPIALTRALLAAGAEDVSVACYPEGHPKAPSPEAEMADLKAKLDAGASRAITQFFFDADVFLDFREKARAAGITKPLVPGLLPVRSLETVHRFAARCGASVPLWLDARFEGLDDDPDTQRALSVATTISLAERLIAAGCARLHLYTLNRTRDALAVARAIQTSAKEAV
jgi:methylenetetrahydrofolate reductase (NADPH)